MAAFTQHKVGVQNAVCGAFLVGQAMEGTEVEELAWLVKDNLYSKHLVLSVEEMFVEFLQDGAGSGSGQDVLQLKPMDSYQRMLLHRLADLFGLAHESVGENEERHLVVAHSADSSIPEVLVSDVLAKGPGEAAAREPHGSKLLLKSESGSAASARGLKRSAVVQRSAVSLEEREAAYSAARERIFADGGSGHCDRVPSARPVPLAARRMIARALGKPRIGDGSPDSARDVPDAEPCDRKDARDGETLAMAEGSPSSSGQGSLQQDDGSRRAARSSARAATRIFAQALVLPVTHPSRQAGASDPGRDRSSRGHGGDVASDVVGRRTPSPRLKYASRVRDDGGPDAGAGRTRGRAALPLSSCRLADDHVASSTSAS